MVHIERRSVLSPIDLHHQNTSLPHTPSNPISKPPPNTHYFSAPQHICPSTISDTFLKGTNQQRLSQIPKQDIPDFVIPYHVLLTSLLSRAGRVVKRVKTRRTPQSLEPPSQFFQPHTSPNLRQASTMKSIHVTAFVFSFVPLLMRAVSSAPIPNPRPIEDIFPYQLPDNGLMQNAVAADSTVVPALLAVGFDINDSSTMTGKSKKKK